MTKPTQTFNKDQQNQNLSPCTPLDARVREQALDTNQSFAVSAPAGSGKTGLLSLRVLSLLGRCEFPEEILCITFTRKAAQEMRERILGALTTAATMTQADIDLLTNDYSRNLLNHAKSAADNNVRRHWQLEKMPYRLKVITIDSFCRSITQQMPLMSTIGGSPSIVEDASTAFESAAKSLLDYSDQHGWPQPLQELFQHLGGDLNRMVSLMISLLHTRDQWLPLIYQSKLGTTVTPNTENAALTGDLRSTLERNLLNWAGDILSELEAALAVYEGELCELLDFAATNLKEESIDSPVAGLKGITGIPSSNNPEQAIAEFWRPLTHAVLTKTGEFLKKPTKNHGFPSRKSKQEKIYFSDKKQQFLNLCSELKGIDGLKENLVTIRDFPQLHYSEAQWLALTSLMDLLPLLTAHLKLIFQENGCVDFIEIAERAREALGHFNNVSDLALKLDYQLKHILVDEFQDTSHAQLDLLKLLTREWAQDASKSLFMVGDGMQSCYSFRNANVGIFLDVRENGLEDKHCNSIDLSVNFRSTSTIVSWVNCHFASAFPKKDNITMGAVSYTPSNPFEPEAATSLQKNTSSFVECQGYVDFSNREIEAKDIAIRITQLLESHPQDSIAILVRSRSHLREILKALQHYKIPYSAVDIDLLESRQYIQDMLALLWVLEDLSDETSWLTLLRCPWCALDNFDLFALFNTQESSLASKPSIWQRICSANENTHISETGKHGIFRLFTTINKAVEHLQRRNIAELIEACWLQLGGPNSLKNHSEAQDIETFLTLVRKHSTSKKIDDKQLFIKALQKLYAQVNTDTNAVQLLTMHKSKGLEFDSVFIPALDRIPRADSTDLLYWHERINKQGDLDIIFSPISASKSTQKNALTALICDERKRKKRLEDTRLLYVACTRAGKRLFLSAQLKSLKDGTVSSPAKSSMLAKLWPTLAPSFQLHCCADGEKAPKDSQRIQTFLQRLPLSTPKPKFTQSDYAIDHLPSYDNSAESNTDAEIMSEANAHTHRAYGTILHRVLRSMSLEGLPLWNSTKIAKAQPFWLAQLQQLGLSHQQAIEQSDNIAACVAPLQNNSTARWVLDNSHTQSQHEYSLHYGAQAKAAIIDRTFIDETNDRWLIDYKSSQPSHNQNLKSFLEQEIERYRPQLKHYRELLITLDKSTNTQPTRYRMALFFPSLLQLVELTNE